ncbi:MAG: peptidase M20, partial [Planctomycetota bacterium]
MNDFEVDSSEALERYLKLTAIPGGSGDEKDVAQAIREMLLAAGLDESAMVFDDAEQRTRISGNCGNLIVQIPGDERQTRRMLS